MGPGARARGFSRGVDAARMHMGATRSERGRGGYTHKTLKSARRRPRRRATLRVVPELVALGRPAARPGRIRPSRIRPGALPRRRVIPVAFTVRRRRLGPRTAGAEGCVRILPLYLPGRLVVEIRSPVGRPELPPIARRRRRGRVPVASEDRVEQGRGRRLGWWRRRRPWRVRRVAPLGRGRVYDAREEFGCRRRECRRYTRASGNDVRGHARPPRRRRRRRGRGWWALRPKARGPAGQRLFFELAAEAFPLRRTACHVLALSPSATSSSLFFQVYVTRVHDESRMNIAAQNNWQARVSAARSCSYATVHARARVRSPVYADQPIQLASVR